MIFSFFFAFMTLNPPSVFRAQIKPVTLLPTPSSLWLLLFKSC